MIKHLLPENDSDFFGIHKDLEGTIKAHLEYFITNILSVGSFSIS